MKSIGFVLAIFLFYTAFSLQSQSPAWITNPNMDAGEVVVVDINVGATYILAPTTKSSPTPQHFNKTNFGVIPNVILSMIGFVHSTPALPTVPFGLRIVITNVTLLNFTYNVTTYGCSVIDLHYLYLAVQYDTTTYYMAILTQSFNASSNLANSTATQRWQTFTYPNPSAWNNPSFSPTNTQVIAFPIGYQIIAQSGWSYFGINASLLSSTHFSVNISTSSNNILNFLDFSVITFNSADIMANYSVYEDLMVSYVVGNSTTYYPPVITAAQYMYRNCLAGAVDITFNISSVPTIGYYYGYTSARDNFLLWRSFNNRVRSCPSNLSYYNPSLVLCQDQCAPYYYVNTTNQLCLPCHYSCQNCSLPNSSVSSCTTCSSLDYRTLASGSCVCNPGFYDSGVSTCGSCNYRCLTCSGLPTSCLSCNASLARVFIGTNQCPCAAGHYDNTTCLTCQSYANACTSCSYNATTSSFNCSACNATLFRTLNSNFTNCECLQGYYEDASLVCQPCPVGCLSCIFNGATPVCSSCNSSLIRQMSASNLTCDCLVGYYSNLNNTCTLCPIGCLMCTSNGSVPICSSCNSSLNRNMSASNLSCDCLPAYYQNSSFSCLPCPYACLACSESSQAICSSCNASLNRTLSSGNTSCICLNGLYENSSQVCVACQYGCLTCYLSASTVVCTSCDSSLMRIMGVGNLTCDCQAGTIEDANQSCIVNTTNTTSNTTNTTNTNTTGNTTINDCGNGIINSAQSCDDGNTNNFDGCSSTCTVEQYHTCINNQTLYNVSLCYYSSKIQLSPSLIYKIPGQNSVRLQLKVSAPKCNTNYLKSYLQQTSSLVMYDKARLLLQTSPSRSLQSAPGWVSIPTKTIVYDSSGSILIIVFDYDATIDLSSKYIEFTPSTNTSPGVRYFYASPTSQLSLSQPYNRLSTTYYSQDDLNTVRQIKYLFLVLVIFYWVFLMVGIVRKRGIIGTECMLVLQITYLTLIDQTKVLEGWSGLQQTGRFTTGYNPKLMGQIYQPDLYALQIDSNLLNVLNVTLGFIVLLFTLLVGYKIYEFVQTRKRIKKLMEINESEEVHSSKNQKIEIKLIDQVMVYVIDSLLSLLFLAISIFVVSIFFTNSLNLTINMTEAALLIIVSIIFWILYYRNKQIHAFKHISYLCIFIKANKTQLHPFVKVITQNYYLFLYVLLLLSALLISLMRNIGIAVFAVIIVGCVCLIGFHTKYKIYLQILDSRRCILNSATIILLMVISLISSILSSRVGTGASLAIVSFIVLLLLLIANATIFVMLQRKRIKREREQQIQEEEMKHMDNELALANISFIGGGLQKGYNSINKSRDYTKDKDFLNSLDYASARRKLLDESNQIKLCTMIEDKIKELKDFKKNIQSQLDPNLPNQTIQISENNATLENVLGELDLTNINMDENEFQAL